MKQEETVIDQETTAKLPIEKVTLFISEGEKDQEGKETGPLVVVSLTNKEETLLEVKFPAQAFNSPAGYGHAIEIAINAYANAQKADTGDKQDQLPEQEG